VNSEQKMSTIAYTDDSNYRFQPPPQ
jgi:hypothetical protein